MYTNGSKTKDYSKHADTAYQQGYRSMNYGIINQWLRENTVSDAASELQDMEKSTDSLARRLATVIYALDQRMQPARRTITVYRGIPNILYESAVQTGIIVNKAFTSTSRQIEQAEKFGSVILRIRVPEHIGRHTFPNAKEEEVLLERNTLCDTFTHVGTSPQGMPIVQCELKKYTPPKSDDITKIKKQMKDRYQVFVKQLELEDEEIDWDAV